MTIKEIEIGLSELIEKGYLVYTPAKNCYTFKRGVLNFMYTNPNQHLIDFFDSAAVSDRGIAYTIWNNEALERAISSLAPGSLKLYVYLLKNKNRKEVYALSSQDVCSFTNMSRRSYSTAFQDLVDKGYLTLKDERTNTYSFHELPINLSFVNVSNN